MSKFHISNHKHSINGVRYYGHNTKATKAVQLNMILSNRLVLIVVTTISFLNAVFGKRFSNGIPEEPYLAAELHPDENEEISIPKDVYNRFLYFSKICALTYCISSGSLFENKTFAEGGCPQELDFCSNHNDNPTIDRTRIELVIEADDGELGTGFVAVDHERHVVMLSFRGSTTRQDWFSDFEIYPTAYEPTSKQEYHELVTNGKISECSNCQIHKGFYRFIETLSKDFLIKVERIFKRYPEYNLVVTGHSLGAALASICGIELKLRGFDPLVLTFATPKIFNEPMKDWVDELFKTKEIHQKYEETGEINLFRGYFRVIHLQDYIPMLPPGYKAAGLEVFIKKQELPHNIQDLEYRAQGSGLTWSNIESNTMTEKQRKNLFEGFGTWLHMEEHRNYFVMINSCSGI